MLVEAAARHGSRTALAHAQGELRHDALAALVSSLADRLVDLGVRHGHRVALQFENSVAFVVAHYAAAVLGAVSVPLQPQLPPPALAAALHVVRARWLLAAPDGGAREGTGTRPGAREAGLPLQRCTLAGHATSSAPLLFSGPGDVRPAALDDRPQTATTWLAPRGARTPAADDPATLFLSSGTTGTPKPIVLSHRQALGGAALWSACWRFGPATRSLMVAPYSHVVYLPLVVGAHGAGGAAVVLPRLLTRAALPAAQRLRATALMGAPAFWLQLLDDPSLATHDLSGLETLIHGAAPMPATAARALRVRFPRCAIFNCYGLTETSSALSVAGPEDQLRDDDSVGRPHPGVEVSIRDADGRVLGVGVRGEVCCRGHHIIRSYEEVPELDADRFHDGWLRTGDRGYLDAAGGLHLAGRMDDVINVAGEKVHPQQVEDVLQAHAEVLEACVLGVPDAGRGYAVKAVVVTRAGRAVSADTLTRHCRAHLPAACVPRQWAFVAALPRNASGKVVRRELR